MPHCESLAETRIPKKWLMGIFSLFLLGLLADRAVAGCGDYVLVNGQLAHASVARSAMEFAESIPTKIPCQGPSCRQIPEVPLPVDRSSDHHRSPLSELICDDAPYVNELLAEVQPARPENLLPLTVWTSIWRPPQ